MNALATPFVQGTEEWLEARLEGIGSSDAPVIAGERGSVLELWGIKTRRIEREAPDAELARLFEWGHRLEPVIADWYTDTTGRPLKRVNRMLIHPTVPYALASLDRVSAVKGERRIVEIKTERWGWKSDEPIPGAVQAQVQHQMWVTGYDVADVAVLQGGSEPRIVEIARDDEYIGDLAFLEERFWAHVQSKTAPKADGSETTRRALQRMHPRENGTWLGQTPELVALIGDLRAARVAKKEAEALEGTLANAVRSIVGDATGVVGLVELKRTADSTRVDWPSMAKVYGHTVDSLVRELRDHVTPVLLEGVDVTTDEGLATVHASLESIYSSTAEGYRSVRLLKESQS